MATTLMARFAGARVFGSSAPRSLLGAAAGARSARTAASGALRGGVFASGTQMRGMANLKAVRNRMRSVGSISKITKAMKMVAAAKLRGVQTLQEKARPFSQAMQGFFGIMDELEKPSGGSSSPAAASGERKRLVVAVTSDRGLCGGVNSSIVKNIKALLQQDSNPENISILLLGDKGRDALQRTAAKNIILSFKDVFKQPPTFTQVCVIAQDILNRDFESITLVYNRFISVISQEPTRITLHGRESMENNLDAFNDYEFDTELEGALAFRDLFEFQLASQIYSALLENSTSEQAARMSAMDNATNNAQDMLGKLTLTYNRQRQAVITSELIEIISGAEALKG